MTETPIADYLAAVAQAELSNDGNVVPSQATAQRIAAEIARVCECRSEILPSDDVDHPPKEVEQAVVSAKPSAFVQETLREITRISDALSKHQAEKFQLIFRNPVDGKNFCQDRISIGAQYMSRAR